MNRRRYFAAWGIVGSLTVTGGLALGGCEPRTIEPVFAGASASPHGAPSPVNTNRGATVLNGEAALLYLYVQHKSRQGTGPQGQYFRSKGGGVYYRDDAGNAVWVSAPVKGISLPIDEARGYQRAARRGQWELSDEADR